MCQIPVLLMVVVVGVVGVAWGAAPCCNPAQWEATVNGFNLYFNVGKFQSLIRSTTAYSYDFTNMRVNQFMNETNVKGEVTFQQVLALYKDKVQYTIDVQSQKCTKLPLYDTMFNCIPDFANFSGSVRYGVNSTVEGTEWNWKFDGWVVQSLSVTDQCYPIVQTWAGFEISQNPATGFAEYVNITPGIKDTSVFEIPQQCQNAQVDSQSRVRRMIIH